MTILLRWLVENAWVLYVLCAIGALVYFVRLLGAARERRLAVFSLERETARGRMAQALITFLVFVGLGGAVLVLTTRVLPLVPMLNPAIPEATATPAAGLAPTPTTAVSATVGVSLTAAPTAQLLTTLTPVAPPDAAGATTTPNADVLAQTPALEVTPEPTPTEQPVLSGQLSTRFGEFAALVGYSVTGPANSAQQPLVLTLTWQALDQPSPGDYMVFTHLVAEDGHLLAQHDSAPAGGARPTSTWVAGEGISDSHLLIYVDAAYSGRASLRIGMYDPVSGARILTDTGADYVLLPITLDIVP